MPKETFFNLPEDKRERILQAASAELVRVPLNEMSINKITQTAEISRGSFYQYFEDKNDLIQHMLSGYAECLKDGIARTAEECGGDVFEAVCRILAGVIRLGENEETRKALRNILEGASGKECPLEFAMTFQEEIIAILVQKADRSQLRHEDDRSVVLLARLLFTQLKEAAAGCLFDMEEAGKAERAFREQIRMIREGEGRAANV